MAEAKKGLVLYHHPCPDGAFAALVIDMLCPGEYHLVPHEINGPRKDPAALVAQFGGTEKVLYLVDYCGPPGFIKEACAHFAKVVLIDHHKTAIDELKEHENLSNFFHHVKLTQSGCILAAYYFVGPDVNPFDVLPMHVGDFLTYVCDNDLFLHRKDYSKEFGAGLRSLNLDFDFQKSPHTLQIMRNLYVPMIIDRGIAAMAREEQQIQAALATAYPVQLGNEIYWAADCQVWEITSELGHRLAKTTGYGCVCRQMDDGKWRLALRSIGPDKDTTVFSKSQGGGGHLNASGCTFPSKAAWDAFRRPDLDHIRDTAKAVFQRIHYVPARDDQV